MAKRKIDKKIKEAKKLIKAIPSNPLEFAKWVMKTTVDELIKLLRPFKDDWNKYRDSTIKAKINKERLVEMVYELMTIKLYTQEELIAAIEKEFEEYFKEEEQIAREVREEVDFKQGSPEFWKKAYKILALNFHPDRGGSDEDMATLNRVIKPLRIGNYEKFL